ncbi:zf-RVT domain-containing protein [Cephalotus follicularis]|uniref:Zf-RVT domain-containing protein n=1 Tax=Cephalotus follicularis TaxID=3775 RepID=A0A1Q3DHL1_CEPFO|nr:zf-RVT domain-containing protein [Cephalotus follicularis]
MRVCWCNTVLLKDKSFWAVKITTASSWSWRNVLRLRECLVNNLVYSIGDGRATSLWLDPWINRVALISRYGVRVVNDAEISINAKVLVVIANRQWTWPRNALNLWEIATLARQISFEQGPDVIHWVSKGKTFSCKAMSREVRHTLSKVAWADIVWFPNCIPKHSFCLWLTFHNAHRTTNKLRTYGVMAANQCMFRCSGLKSIDHLLLFFVSLQRGYGTTVFAKVVSEGYANLGWRKQYRSQIS